MEKPILFLRCWWHRHSSQLLVYGLALLLIVHLLAVPWSGYAEDDKSAIQLRSEHTPWNPLTWQWVPTEQEIAKYRQSWNPLSNGPILLTSVDINPAGQFHMQLFGFGETGHQAFGNTLTTHRTDSPIHLNAFEPLLVLGYGLTDHLELDAAFSGLYWQSTEQSAGTSRSSTSETGIGDTAVYLKYRPIVQDSDSWRPSLTVYNQVTIPTSMYFGTRPIPGNFSPLGKLPASPFGGLELTEGLLLRKNLKPFRISGGVFYTYTLPSNQAGMNNYMGDIVNTRFILEHILDESRGFGYNLEVVTIHGLPFRADRHAVNIAPSSFQLFGIEPAIQYRFGDHWVGAAGVLFTVAGQNNLDAIYPNFSFYYYWDKKGGATMR